MVQFSDKMRVKERAGKMEAERKKGRKRGSEFRETKWERWDGERKGWSFYGGQGKKNSLL